MPSPADVQQLQPLPPVFLRLQIFVILLLPPLLRLRKLSSAFHCRLCAAAHTLCSSAGLPRLATSAAICKASAPQPASPLQTWCGASSSHTLCSSVDSKYLRCHADAVAQPGVLACSRTTVRQSRGCRTALLVNQKWKFPGLFLSPLPAVSATTLLPT